MRKTLVTLALSAILFIGCIESNDPNTGQTAYRLDPNHKVVKILDEGAIFTDKAKPAIEGISILVPSLASIGGALIGLAAMWRRMHKPLTEAQIAANLSYTAGGELATILEWIKTNYPDKWTEIAKKIDRDKMTVWTSALENIVRGWRGLPPL